MRVCNIERLDNGFIVQTESTDEKTAAGIQGMLVFQDANDVMDEVAKLLGVSYVEKASPEAATVTTSGPTLPSGAPLPAGVPAPTPQDAAPVEAFDFLAMDPDSQLAYLIIHNDRDRAKTILDDLVVRGFAEEYSNRVLIKGLCERIEAGWKAEANQAAAPVGATIEQVQEALQGAAVRLSAVDPIGGGAKVMELLTRRGVSAASELDGSMWQDVIDEANQMVG